MLYQMIQGTPPWEEYHCSHRFALLYQVLNLNTESNEELTPVSSHNNRERNQRRWQRERHLKIKIHVFVITSFQPF